MITSDILSADQTFADDPFDVGLPVIEFGTYRGIRDDSPIAVILQSPLRDMQRLAYFLRAEPFLPCGAELPYDTIPLRRPTGRTDAFSVPDKRRFPSWLLP